MISPNSVKNLRNLLVLRDAAERVAVEVQRARDMLVGELDPGGLETKSDLCGDGVHGGRPTSQPRKSMQRRRGIHLEECQRPMTKTRKPAVDRKHGGIQLPLRLPCWTPIGRLEPVQILGLPSTSNPRHRSPSMKQYGSIAEWRRVRADAQNRLPGTRR